MPVSASIDSAWLIVWAKYRVTLKMDHKNGYAGAMPSGLFSLIAQRLPQGTPTLESINLMGRVFEHLFTECPVAADGLISPRING